jgi:hypothetical protein
MAGRRYEQQFELRVIPQGDAAYGLALYQTRVAGLRQNGDGHARVVRVWGDPLKAVIQQVLDAVRRSGYRPSDLTRSRRAPFVLREEDGVRLGVLFLAVKPLRKHVRIEAISDRLREMEPEELFYWYSKSMAAGEGRKAQRALRIMIADD